MFQAVEKTYEIVTTMCQTSTTKNIVAGIPSEHSRTGTLMTEYNTLSEKTFISYIKMLGKVGAVSDYIEDIYQFIDKYENIKFGHAEQTVVDHVKEICKRCVVAGCLKSVNVSRIRKQKLEKNLRKTFIFRCSKPFSTKAYSANGLHMTYSESKVSRARSGKKTTSLSR